MGPGAEQVGPGCPEVTPVSMALGLKYGPPTHAERASCPASCRAQEVAPAAPSRSDLSH